jgi:hypothetical protein
MGRRLAQSPDKIVVLLLVLCHHRIRLDELAGSLVNLV